jgi:hypothetical protein
MRSQCQETSEAHGAGAKRNIKQTSRPRKACGSLSANPTTNFFPSLATSGRTDQVTYVTRKYVGRTHIPPMTCTRQPAVKRQPPQRFSRGEIAWHSIFLAQRSLLPAAARSAHGGGCSEPQPAAFSTVPGRQGIHSRLTIHSIISPRPHSPADVSRIQGPGPSAGKRDRGGPETWARETPRSPKAIFFFYPFIQETQRVGWYLGTRARAPTALRRALWERQSGRPRCVLWSGPAVCLLSCRRTSCFPPRCDKWESRVRQKVGSHTGGFGAETAPVSSGARMQE